MGIQTTKQILQHRQQNGHRSVTADLLEVDTSKPFVPEQYTQLYHTPVYSDLNTQQKIRYNQLFAARINEQFMLFESGFTRRVMQNMLKHRSLENQPLLRQCLQLLLEEENMHFRMFRDLNRHCLPDVYQANTYQFLKPGIFQQVAMNMACRFPQHLISLLWLVLLMEEHAVRFSKDMIEYREKCSLGPLESNFVHIHKRHLADELGHTHIDARLLECVLETSSDTKKKLNIKLLKILLKLILKPRQAGINVIKQLISEYPTLRAHQAKFIREISMFDYDPCILPMFRDETHMPVTSILLSRFPEFKHAMNL